jgi:ribosomal protein S18 acetylase RimI-like enzyme
MTQAPPSRSALDRSRLTIQPLTEQSVEAFTSFSCGDADLDDFIRSDALRLHALNVARTYVAHYDGHACGYVALMADAIVLKPNERKRIRANDGNALTFDDHPVVPALKIARLAVNKSTRDGSRGIGEALVRFSFLTALDLAELAGCRLLTLDAYQQSLGFYERLGFVRNLDRAYADRDNPSMRLDLFAAKPPDWL